MKVRITNGTIVNGEDARPGTVLDVERYVAIQLFIANKAVPVADAPEEMTNREVKTVTAEAFKVKRKSKRNA